MDDLDNVMDVLNSLEAKKQAVSQASQTSAGGRVLVGEVDHFFDKINVAAVRLSGKLEVGDTIEIENDEYTLKQRVSSMQINRKEVYSAAAGDDVGIKLSVPVPRGSQVYKVG